MAFLIDEKKLINDNIFLHEERLNSQYTRFLDKAQTYVDYRNVNNIESTADLGFQAIEEMLGPNSPLRYKLIKDFPIYGIDQILLDLSDEEQGLDTSYDGEAVILPNTIKPLPHDFFTVSYLDKHYLFMVTSVAYDTIKSNNYYKINFKIKSLEGPDIEDLEKQTTEKYNCVLTNIGTKDKCLIKEDEISLLVDLNSAYTALAERYKMFFYNKKYNAFMFIDENVRPGAPFKFYDRYMSEFINAHGLFSEKNNYESFHLTVERRDHKFEIQYHDSIYKAIELRKRSLITDFKFKKLSISDVTSIFAIHRDRMVRDIDLGFGDDFYVPAELISSITENKSVPEYNIVWETIIKYLNGDIESIYHLRLDNLMDYHSYTKYDFESFILIPILLYIMKDRYKVFMTVN